MKNLILTITFLTCQFTFGQSVGQPCNSNEEAAKMPGKYLTAAEYPWPAARAEYFRDLNATDRPSAKLICEQIEKIEQNSRNNTAPIGGSLEDTFTAYNYQFYNSKKFAVYGTSLGFYKWDCYSNKMKRNGEFNTVLRVYVNAIPFKELERISPIRLAFSNPGEKYFFKDWKTYKDGQNAQTIDLYSYISYSVDAGNELLDTMNSGNGYWQNVPENEIRKDTFNHIYRYWFIKKNTAPLLVEVSRKEYLESLLEYFEREKLYLADKTAKLDNNQKKYYENWQSVIENKIQRVSKALQENNAAWLLKQAVVNWYEDKYQNDRENMSEYISDYTFRKFYDEQKESVMLYKMNPAYFSGLGQKATDPAFMVLSFRYVSKPAHVNLMNNFTENLDKNAWQKLLK